MKCPILFGPLKVKLFVFGNELVVVFSELLLKAEVLLVKWFRLFLKKLVFHRG